MATKKNAKAKKKPDVKPGLVTASSETPGMLTVTVTGPASEVRRALEAMRFDESRVTESVEAVEWTITVARQIAIEQTVVDGAELDDELAGQRVRMFSQTDRNLYRDRCVLAAKSIGHTVAKPASIPVKEKTTVMQVGDALFTA